MLLNSNQLNKDCPQTELQKIWCTEKIEDFLMLFYTISMKAEASDKPKKAFIKGHY
jgi:hypothetical protein